ncbi:hypothetical protein EZJ43_07985 [Pedobacter changchengzhani]|uniref:Uncharacterized protein n=1 Tax=Pedobacter changchengzhani TaxID=2529274 RepID=A0A4R5MLE2_9SPHI|nr:hypothetical protein [Pedobacter changchengzhani]TDG36448.1 hypothetical protein EZJ43_07985 [Pedobacter changchengzhani]
MKNRIRRNQLRYLQILIRLAFLIVPIVILYFLVVFNYNPHERCIGDEHRHTMGPMFGFLIFSGFIVVIWLLAMIIELIYRRFDKNKKVAYWLIFLVVMASLAIMFFI